MKPFYTQAFDSIENCSIAALETGGTLNATRSLKRVSLFSTRKSALHSAGSLFASDNFSYAE